MRQRKMESIEVQIRLIVAIMLVSMAIFAVLSCKMMKFISAMPQKMEVICAYQIPETSAPVHEEEIPQDEETDGFMADETAEHLAKLVYGEARGCSTVEQAAVVWCAINRTESDDPFYPDTLVEVITQENQFQGYDEDNAVLPSLLELAQDVLDRWSAEQSGENNVGRVLPANYLWFYGDGEQNHFRTQLIGGDTWDWSLENPYAQ